MDSMLLDHGDYMEGCEDTTETWRRIAHAVIRTVNNIREEYYTRDESMNICAQTFA